MIDESCLKKIILLPPDTHRKDLAKTPPIGSFDGIWKPQGFALCALQLSLLLDKNQIIGVLNCFRLREDVLARIGQWDAQRRHQQFLFDFICHFGNDSSSWPIAKIQDHGTKCRFSLSALPQLRIEAPTLQHVHCNNGAGTQSSLTVIAGIDKERFAGTMRHIAEMCADHAEKQLAKQAENFQMKMNAREVRFEEVSKENARMREQIAMIANCIEDALFRPPKCRRWPFGPTKKKIMGEAMIRAADELRAVLIHAYSALA